MKILDSEIQRYFNTKNWKIALRYHDQDVVDEIVIRETVPGELYDIDAVVTVYGYKNRCSIVLNAEGILTDFPVSARIARIMRLPADISV